MAKVKAIPGIGSQAGMISTAQWGGALLKDILEDAGLEDEEIESLGVEHVQFEALDFDMTGTSYGVSIAISKAMDRKGDVLLAYEMNGEDLPLDHGYPVRVIVPGVAACRSVKWLGKIIVSDKESESFWQQNKYRGFPPNTDTKSSEFNLSPSIQEFPVTSVVCHPKENQSFSRQNDECIPMKGYAWSGGGRSIIRVDISVDGGKTWTVANLKRQEQPRGRQWAWTFWECDVTIPVGVNKLQVVCKAVDSSYNDGREDPAQGVEFPKPFLVMTKARQAPGQRVIEDWERKNLGSYYIVLVCLYQ
ncbi:hypothetical protein QZH41_000694 [Actinostola sp. cb2023]|nr:hypothetical protein QZH41_000694 [Actinostola sp. cb2023]